MAKDCFMPWYGFTLSGRGDVKPCCQFRGSVASVHRDGGDISSLYNASLIKAAREDFLADKEPAACSSCWERESQIGHSRRIWFKEKFEKYIDKNQPLGANVETPQWVQMDINLSNMCNLKCRMCGSWASHKWIDDEKALGLPGNPYKRETNPENLKLFEVSLESLAGLLPHMKNVQRIDFKGGEPMLSKHHNAFLQMLIDEGLHHQVTLHYTTNGTVINPKIIDMLSQFHKVNVVFSIEGTDPLYSYIRGGKDYSTSQIVENLALYDQLDNVKIMSNVAIQAYNLPNLKELYHYLHSLNFKNFFPQEAFKCIVNAPIYLSPFVWPLSYRKLIAEELMPIGELKYFAKQLISVSENRDLFTKFLSFTYELDKVRNEDFFKIFPELRHYAQEAGRSGGQPRP